MNLSCQARRSFLSSTLCSTPFFYVPGLMAEALTQTPKQTEGPFYPDRMPLDTDNDLIIINDSLTPAVGTIAYLSGKVTDLKGNPLRNTLVEIWQVDSNGIYLHSKGGPRNKWDSNFQGYGRFLTNTRGEYFFRTLKPTFYSGRTPHIHMAVSAKGKDKLTTQCYIQGEARNKQDFILNRIKNKNLRNSLIVPFDPLPDSKLGEVTAQFNIVLDWTPPS